MSLNYDLNKIYPLLCTNNKLDNQKVLRYINVLLKESQPIGISNASLWKYILSVNKNILPIETKRQIMSNVLRLGLTTKNKNEWPDVKNVLDLLDIPNEITNHFNNLDPIEINEWLFMLTNLRLSNTLSMNKLIIRGNSNLEEYRELVSLI